MAGVESLRIAGREINPRKKLWVGLATIYGVGYFFSKRICVAAGIDYERRGSTLKEDEVRRLNNIITADYIVEGDLRQEVSDNIKRLMDIGCYRGLRHRKGLPVHGQRTRTNARTRKGKALPIANKKKV